MSIPPPSRTPAPGARRWSAEQGRFRCREQGASQPRSRFISFRTSPRGSFVNIKTSRIYNMLKDISTKVIDAYRFFGKITSICLILSASTSGRAYPLQAAPLSLSQRRSSASLTCRRLISVPILPWISPIAEPGYRVTSLRVTGFFGADPADAVLLFQFLNREFYRCLNHFKPLRQCGIACCRLRTHRIY